ncbi:MAG: hypothetical protein Q4C98_10370 [Capnocytophaga sp.]|nr:hypothetical protein [Capnocytophaga sp.]
MNLEVLNSLLGKAINSDEMLTFLQEKGFKYPKKDSISNRKTERYFWIENKKLKIDLLFSIDIKNGNFKAIPAEKKGIFYPILTHIRIYGDMVALPYDIVLKKEIPYDEMVSKLGNPTVKSSDAAKVWLNDDGTESWYRWEIDTQADKTIRFDLSDENIINDFWIELKQNQDLFILYDELSYQNFDSFKKKLNHRDVSALMFVRWAIENNLIIPTKQNEAIISALKTTENNQNELLLDFVKNLGRGMIYEEDFIAEKQNNIRKYINNIDVKSYYYDDFCKLFLKNTKLSYDKQDKELDKIAILTEENYQKVKNLLDTMKW